MYRCGAETATTERPCGIHVSTPGRCRMHQDKPLGPVVDLAAYRRAKASRDNTRRALRAAR